MAYIDAATLAVDSIFRQKIQVGIITAAIDIVGEESSGDTQRDSARKALGIQVLNNPSAFLERFAWAVCANPAITALSLDSDIQFTINSRWDDIAGV